MKKRIAWGCGGTVIAACAVGAVLVWRTFSGPMYTPGMVRSETGLRAPLEPPPQAPDQGSYWRVEPDIRLHYREHGAGAAVLVVHGGPGLPMREPLAALDSLTGRYRFFYYDQRGCGGSSRPFERFESANFYANMVELERTLGLGAQIADIERIRRILNQDQLVLLGHSFGAFLASMYAAEFPEHVAALVLISPAGVLVLPAAENDLFVHIRQRLPASERGEFDAFVDDYLNFGGVFQKSEAELAGANLRLADYYLRAAGESPPSAADPDGAGGWIAPAVYFSMGRRHDYRAALSRVAAPTLVIHGGADISPVSVSRMYAEHLPSAQLQVIDQAGHFPHYDRPIEFAGIVADFLAQVE